MNIDEVKELAEFVHSTFGKATPNADKVKFYYDEIYTLDGNALEFIKQQLRELDNWPSNILKAIKNAYAGWQRKQPAYYRKTHCDTCNGYGLLTREEYDERDKQTYAYTSRCPKCDNWRRHTSEGTPLAQLDRYEYKQNGSSEGTRDTSGQIYPLHKCDTCNSTGYLCSMEMLPKPEWGIKSVDPKLRPVTWTCPYCKNWETGPWAIERRCDPPDNQTLVRCIPWDEDFSKEYLRIVGDMFKGAQSKAVV